MTGHLLYTEEDVTAVSNALFDIDRTIAPSTRGAYDARARAALAALSSSGRLLPPGSEVREEYGVQSQRPGYGVEFSTPQSPENRDEDWARDFAEFVSNPSIMVRRVITTPWSVPDTEPEG